MKKVYGIIKNMLGLHLLFLGAITFGGLLASYTQKDITALYSVLLLFLPGFYTGMYVRANWEKQKKDI